MSTTNAVLRRIDLTCKLLSPMVRLQPQTAFLSQHVSLISICICVPLSLPTTPPRLRASSLGMAAHMSAPSPSASGTWRRRCPSTCSSPSCTGSPQGHVLLCTILTHPRGQRFSRAAQQAVEQSDAIVVRLCPAHVQHFCGSLQRMAGAHTCVVMTTVCLAHGHVQLYAHQITCRPGIGLALLYASILRCVVSAVLFV